MEKKWKKKCSGKPELKKKCKNNPEGWERSQTPPPHRTSPVSSLYGVRPLCSRRMDLSSALMRASVLEG